MNLNVNQQLAVTNDSKRLLIIAGAGTGKTYTIVEKIAYLIEHGFVNPENIVATTFTSKAAGELLERLSKRLSHAAKINIGTFHSLSLDVLQQYGNYADANILSAELQLKLVSDIIEKNKFAMINPSKMVDKIQRSKEGLSSMMTQSEASIFELYKAHLKNNNALDFSDLITLVLKLWENNSEALLQCQQKFRLLCIDEFQDISILQCEWISKLLTDETRLICVGDPDQAIYGFRGASCEFIINFAKYFPGASIIKLECNYRSGTAIIEAANRLIKHNKNRPEKNLYSFYKDLASSVQVKSFSSQKLEAMHIAKEVLTLEPEIAILVRNRSQMMPIAESLSALGINYISAGGAIERAEVKDLRAHMAFVLNTRDLEAFERSISTRPGVGKATIKKIIDIFNKGEVCDLLEAIQNVAPSVRQRDSLLEFVDISQNAQMFTNVSHLASFLFSHYCQNLEETRKANLLRWIELLPNVLVRDYFRSSTKKGVHLMTIHASKGLEFDSVFLPCWEEGVLPYHGAIGFEIEEERRLAYVALTRAKKNLYISYSTTRLINNRVRYTEASIFIDELREGVGFPEPQKPKPSLAVGDIVLHKTYGRGSVIECGARAVSVKFFSGIKLVMISEVLK